MQLLVDVSMIMHRSYHALDTLENSKGTKTGMEFGTLNSLDKLQLRFKNLIVCFDNYRKGNDEYKAHRTEKPASFYKRVERLSGEIRKKYSYAIQDNTEADTLMYSLATMGNGSSAIYTNDKDMYFALSETTYLIKSFRSEEYIWTPDTLWDEFRLRPYMWPLFRALTGDPSDNLPKCRGFGKEYSTELVRASYHTGITDECEALAHVIDKCSLTKKQKENWNAFRKQLLFNYGYTHIVGKEVQIQPPTGGNITPYLRELEINSLDFSETEF